jgi:hypothetical protein
MGKLIHRFANVLKWASDNQFEEGHKKARKILLKLFVVLSALWRGEFEHKSGYESIYLNCNIL